MCSLGITFLLFVQNCRKLILRKTILVSSKMMSISINLISTINPSNETTPIIWYSTASVYGCVSVCVCKIIYSFCNVWFAVSQSIALCLAAPTFHSITRLHVFSRLFSYTSEKRENDREMPNRDFRHTYHSFTSNVCAIERFLIWWFCVFTAANWCLRHHQKLKQN